ncbi:MAG: arylamine N-acetyltransferase, partial [Clostridiales bacterium]|nr:arylamine N-acetyltransferase [Clostridiales bacterium]
MGTENFYEKIYGKYNVKFTDAETDRYLNRIGLTRAEVSLDREGLNKLQRSHLWSVPFENIDLFDYDRPVDFGTAEVFDKIVNKNRGGYCFELNAALMLLIEALGFTVHAAGARIVIPDNPEELPMPLTHRASIVTIDGKRYYCDVGFGMTTAPLIPVCLDERDEQDIAGDIFTVEDRP